jgi:hypothetical protein
VDAGGEPEAGAASAGAATSTTAQDAKILGATCRTITREYYKAAEPVSRIHHAGPAHVLTGR